MAYDATFASNPNFELLHMEQILQTTTDIFILKTKVEKTKVESDVEDRNTLLAMRAQDAALLNTAFVTKMHSKGHGYVEILIVFSYHFNILLTGLLSNFYQRI